MRVVLDTNVLISRLLVAGSAPAKAFDLAITQHEVVCSTATMEELADVLSRRRFDRYVSVSDRVQFMRRLLQVLTMIEVITQIDECRDPKDDKFLALALDAGVDCIVSGDRDLLAMSPWREIKIVAPADFLGISGQ